MEQARRDYGDRQHVTSDAILLSGGLAGPWQRGMDGSDVVEALQMALEEAGYYHGKIDRWCGPETIRAIC